MMGGIAGTSPFDALFTLNERQLAALIVVLVVVPGALQQFEALHSRNTAVASGSAAAPAVATTGGGGRSRHVRPPRAC